MTCIINPNGTASCSAPGGGPAGPHILNNGGGIVSAGLPAPGSTITQANNDPGYLIAQPDGTTINAQGNIYIPQGILVRKVNPNIRQLPPGMMGVSQIPTMEGITTGNATKSIPAQFQVQWNSGAMTDELASDLNIVGPAVVGCTDPNMANYDPNANTEGPKMIGGNICGGLIIDAQGIDVLPGTKVDINFGDGCGPCKTPDQTCTTAAKTFTGITTGNSANRPSDGYMMWEVEFMCNGNPVTDYFVPSQMTMVQTTPPYGQLQVEPPPLACGQDEYKVPLSKIGGEDKCVDKTLALVLGAVGLYFLLAKDK